MAAGESVHHGYLGTQDSGTASTLAEPERKERVLKVLRWQINPLPGRDTSLQLTAH